MVIRNLMSKQTRDVKHNEHTLKLTVVHRVKVRCNICETSTTHSKLTSVVLVSNVVPQNRKEAMVALEKDLFI